MSLRNGMWHGLRNDIIMRNVKYAKWHKEIIKLTDFRAVVSVLPCNPTNKGKKNLCGCTEKANRQWAFVAFWLSSYVNIKTAAAFATWLAPKKDALFSLIYLFGSFCIYYIPHNYVIPQAMPHAIWQIHSASYFDQEQIKKKTAFFDKTMG